MAQCFACANFSVNTCGMSEKHYLLESFTTAEELYIFEIFLVIFFFFFGTGA
jgi:hypothetical protein